MSGPRSVSKGLRGAIESSSAKQKMVSTVITSSDRQGGPDGLEETS